jgi:predicted metal-dependent HD superfamily phosphohydrolase
MHWPLPDRLELRDELLAAYDRDGYHDHRHLAEVLDRLAELGCDGSPEWDAVWLAAWFHDSVYDGDRDDEERSARRASETLPGALGEEVARLVRMTADHRPADDDRAACLLSDADLAVLASPPERYDQYVADVRREYAHLDDDTFSTGRVAVLENLLAKPHLFHTPYAREHWEAAARANLERELSR